MTIELSHHDGDCLFETILCRYELDDPVLRDLARIGHEADLADDRYEAPGAPEAPEAPGLDIICRDVSMTHDDTQAVAIGTAMLHGIYEHRLRALLLGRDPA